jgi:hypothetical protein
LGDHPLCCQALEGAAGADPEQPGDGHAAIRHDDFLSLANPLQPFTQMRSQIADGNVHITKCTGQLPPECTSAVLSLRTSVTLGTSVDCYGDAAEKNANIVSNAKLA